MYIFHISFVDIFLAGFLNRLNSPITRTTITIHINKFLKFAWKCNVMANQSFEHQKGCVFYTFDLDC